MIEEVFWLNRALQLASKGLGKVQPNPLVGAVIVHNEHVIGEGFHQQYGMPHAEVNAIYAVENQELLKKSTLYVNLEPCAHFGKTPPCASLIIEKRIPKVVVGMKDPNQKVNGKGIKMLRNAGIEVLENVLFDECLTLNKRFVTFHAKKRPYIFLKWAQTSNGFMDIIRKEQFTQNYWITNESLRVFAHKMRNEEQAVLIGYDTLINDNPQLTNRLYSTNQPQRFVLCNTPKPAELDPSFTVLEGTVEEAVNELYNRNIQSVIVEGGKNTLERFLDKNLWDEIFVLESNAEWVRGVEAPRLTYHSDNKMNIEGEKVLHYIKKQG